ncbi:MAG: helix-turn-helix transcriptional regulator [Clostridia bacterium]|nr:helix-turn-helix transcriptional regulator [Clostridia bacterium]
MDDLKKIIANNISQLRRDNGVTQLELAERLNYSDKAVSKWERGESYPDVATLKEIADMFSVTVDYLLQAEHVQEKVKRREYTRKQKRNRFLIAAISCVLVWLIATFVFTSMDMIPQVRGGWLAFVYAVPVTAIVCLVFNSIWGRPRMNFVIISVLMWSVLATVCLTMLTLNLWLLFLVGIPGQIIIVLWAGIRK